MIELTLPSEHRIEVSNEMKKAKYAPIVEEARQKGWRVQIWAAEVGCRGFPARSVAGLLSDLGYTGRERKDLLRKRCGRRGQQVNMEMERYQGIG